MGDINNYHASCSLMAGVTELTKAIENRKPSRAEIEGKIARLSSEIANTKGHYDAADLPAVRVQRQKLVMDLMDARD